MVVCNVGHFALKPAPVRRPWTGRDTRFKSHWQRTMQEILLVIHLLVAIAMIAVVLLQRSEGGALGIGGGGGGSGGMFSPRGAGNILTKTTVLLAAAFFITSISLTLINRESGRPGSIIDSIGPAQQGEGEGQTGGDGSVLPRLPDSGNANEPRVPVSE